MSSAQTRSSLAADAPRYGNNATDSYYQLNEVQDGVTPGFINIFFDEGTTIKPATGEIMTSVGRTIPLFNEIIVSGTLDIAVPDDTEFMRISVQIKILNGGLDGPNLIPGASYQHTLPPNTGVGPPIYDLVTFTAGYKVQPIDTILPGSVVQVFMNADPVSTVVRPRVSDVSNLCIWYQ